MRLSFVVTVGAVFCTTSIHSTSPEVGTPGFQSKSMSDKVNTESFLKPRHRHHIELPKVYSKQGDINLGGIFRFTEHLNDQDRLCGDTLRSPGLFQYAESMAWYLSGVNKNPDLLPGINLGYIIVDDCAKDQVAIARALEFADPDDCSNMNISETSSQVMSVMTASGSQQTLAIASIFSLFKVPLVAAWATSEELEKKNKFTYFERTVPPDYYQAKAIVDILVKHNWTFVAVLYSADAYGTRGAERVVELAGDQGVCVQLSQVFVSSSTSAQYRKVVSRLSRDTRVKVIVLFSDMTDVIGFLNALRDHRKQDYVIIGSDAVNPRNLHEFGDIINNSFFIDLYWQRINESFYSHFENITYSNTVNPWMKNLFMQQFNCSTNGSDQCSELLRVGDMPYLRDVGGVSLYVDALQLVVKVLDYYIRRECGQLLQHSYQSSLSEEEFRHELNHCIHPEELMPYIRLFINHTIDEKYQLNQMQYDKDTGEYVVLNIGTWFIKDESLYLEDYKIKWHNSILPISVCSIPCGIKQFHIQKEMVCCWECRYCHANEIIVANGTSCHECSPYTWPDQNTATFCTNIASSHYLWTSNITLIVTIFSCIGLAVCICTLTFFILNRHKPLIKATDVELSLIGVFGVGVAYLAAALMVIPPTLVVCYTGNVLMNLGFTITYASLLIKTLRIYRVFHAAKYSAIPPSYITTKYQMGGLAVLIVIQVVLLVTLAVLNGSEITLRMPVTTVEFVELMCQVEPETFLPPIGYNMILLFACCICAVKTRKLPDNFNESKLIFLHVLATLFLWLAFLPTYLAADNAMQKAMLLSMLLLISSTLTTLCLHIPKVYATIYLNKTPSSKTKMVSSTSQSSN